MRLGRHLALVALAPLLLAACNSGYRRGTSTTYYAQPSSGYAQPSGGYAQPSGGAAQPSGSGYGQPSAGAGYGGGDGSTAAAPGTVQIRNHAYEPATITVRVGDNVRWTNYDTVEHTVTCPVIGGFDLRVPAGGTVSWTFREASDAAGFAYYCTIHPKMQGRVIVQR
jgi:plastocyanin